MAEKKFYEIEFKFTMPKSITVYAENAEEALKFAEDKTESMVSAFLDLFYAESDLKASGFNIVTTWNRYPTARDDSIGIYESKEETNE